MYQCVVFLWKILQFSQERSRENFLVWSRSWSCIATTFVHIKGCQWGNLSFCWQIWNHIWEDIEIILESWLTWSSISLCVWDKLVGFYIFFYYSYIQYWCTCTLSAYISPNAEVWLVRSIELNPNNQTLLEKINIKCCKFVQRNFTMNAL